MAPQVIDLISSSPSLPAREASPLASSPIAIDSPQRNKHRRSRPHSPNLFVTSDLDIADDESARHDARTAKRPRISENESLPVNPPRAPPQPPFLSAPPNRSNRVEFDPIEFTSSLEPKTPNIHHDAGTSSDASRPVQTCQAPPNTGLSSDPFASSPPNPPPPPVAAAAAADAASKQIPKQRTTTNTTTHDLTDPFASSPLPPHQRLTALPVVRGSHTARERPESAHPVPSDVGSPDPFASSQDANLPRPANASVSRRAVSVEVTDQAWRRRHWDPISSSAPEQTPRVSHPKRSAAEPRDSGPVVISIDSDSAGTSDDEFPDIADFGVSSFRPRPRSPMRRSRSDIISSMSSRPKAASATTAEQRARDKEALAAARAAEKERKRLEKEQLKQAKALEKERATALAEVNKVRTDKKVSTPEMILNMPSGITEGLKVQLETLLDGLTVEHTTWNSPVANAFKWQRKVRSRFDEEMGHWEPIPLRIMPEKHVLILMTADEFVGMAVDDTVDSSVSQAKRHFPGHELIYLLEGMNLWLRKNRNIRNRRFTSGVRAQDQPPPEGTAASSSSTTTTTAAPRRRRKNAAAEEYIAEDIVEDAMLRLQIEHDVLIHHTSVPLESAQWIVAFTQHISTIPYKKMRDKMTSAAGFCMESGQVRTGDDARDTYARMLQEIARVTAPIAYGIVSEFDSVSKLVTGLERGGPSALESVRKSVNKDGVASERTVGQAVSRRIHKVFTGRDETSTDV